MTSSEVFGDSGTVVASSLYRVSEPISPHSHDFLEMAIVLAGTGVHVTQQGSAALAAGTVLVVRPGQWHGYERCLRLDVFNVYIAADVFRRELAWILDHPRLARFVMTGGRSVDLLHRTARERIGGWLAYLEQRGDNRGRPDAILPLGLLSCVLGEIAELEFDTGSSPSAVISQRVRDAMELMSLDPSEQWTMGLLGARLNVSISHLHRQFSSQVGSSPMNWLTRLRAERAAVLLIQTGLPIAEIGRSVGWLDASYASRRFQQLHGMTPREYRSRFGFGPEA